MNSPDFESTVLEDERDAGETVDGEPGVKPFHQFRAPKEHGEALIWPSLSTVPELIANNRQLFEHQESFQALRRDARRQLIEDACRYTSSYRDISWFDAAATADQPIMMAGHQPAVFHAGVWFKNFALSQLARCNNSIAVNLVIDNDVASGSSIRVPTLDRETGLAVYRSIPYDRAGGGVPYEQTTIDDRELFDSFDRRVVEAVAPLVDNPCVTRLWKHARHAVERCGVAGCAVAQARHGLEGEIGLRTLEVPLGVVCRTAAFCEFVLMILTELPRFQRCYNDSAQCYRKAHHIRSSSHPVPDLAEDGQWFEAPLWIYSNESPQRRAAWVKLSDDQLVISDRAGREVAIDIRFPKLASEKLRSVIGPEFKLRPRALLTTMYARLVMSDLFLHGIGGGKYDQLGDMIMRAFFMVTPPSFMVISATVKLPGISGDSREDRIRELHRIIRDTEYQPERFADRYEMDSALMLKKNELLASVPERGRRKAWHRQLEQINRELARPLQSLRESLRVELAAERRNASSHHLLASREHPFCIFPLDYLVETYERLLTRDEA